MGIFEPWHLIIILFLFALYLLPVILLVCFIMWMVQTQKRLAKIEATLESMQHHAAGQESPDPKL